MQWKDLNMRNGKGDMDNSVSEGHDKQGATDTCMLLSSLMKHNLSLDL